MHGFRNSCVSVTAVTAADVLTAMQLQGNVRRAFGVFRIGFSESLSE